MEKWLSWWLNVSWTWRKQFWNPCPSLLNRNGKYMCNMDFFYYFFLLQLLLPYNLQVIFSHNAQQESAAARVIYLAEAWLVGLKNTDSTFFSFWRWSEEGEVSSCLFSGFFHITFSNHGYPNAKAGDGNIFLCGTWKDAPSTLYSKQWVCTATGWCLGGKAVSNEATFKIVNCVKTYCDTLSAGRHLYRQKRQDFSLTKLMKLLFYFGADA